MAKDIVWAGCPSAVAVTVTRRGPRVAFGSTVMFRVPRSAVATMSLETRRRPAASLAAMRTTPANSLRSMARVSRLLSSGCKNNDSSSWSVKEGGGGTEEEEEEFVDTEPGPRENHQMASP